MIRTSAVKPLMQAAYTRTGLLGRRLSQLDPGTTAVKLVAAGLVIGTMSIALSDARTDRSTDTLAEVVARIAPVGSVTVGSMDDGQRTADAAVTGVRRDS